MMARYSEDTVLARGRRTVFGQFYCIYLFSVLCAQTEDAYWSTISTRTLIAH